MITIEIVFPGYKSLFQCTHVVRKSITFPAPWVPLITPMVQLTLNLFHRMITSFVSTNWPLKEKLFEETLLMNNNKLFDCDK